MPLFRLEEDKLIIAQETNVELEEHLEDWLENSPWALTRGESFLWIGRQSSVTIEGNTIFLDLLGVDIEGNLVVAELKRGIAPRDVIAQVLEYAAWANELSDEQIKEIAETYFNKRSEFQGKNFYEAFCDEFEADDFPTLNRKLRLFIVASEIPARILNVCKFLRSEYRFDVSCIEISMFRTESEEVIVSVEAKLRDEEIVLPISSKPKNTQIGKSTREIVWEVILEINGGDPNGEFETKRVKEAVLDKHPNFNINTIHGRINHFRQSKQVVSEAIEELENKNGNSDFPETEAILEVVLREHPRFNKSSIRAMINLFRESSGLCDTVNDTDPMTRPST